MFQYKIVENMDFVWLLYPEQGLIPRKDSMAVFFSIFSIHVSKHPVSVFWMDEWMHERQTYKVYGAQTRNLSIWYQS